MRKQIITVYGTRPEAIKVVPVITALRDDDRFDSKVINTGQHREMVKQVDDLFDIAPDLCLSIMEPDQTLNGIVSSAINKLDCAFSELKPDAVIVQGDTSTAMAAAVTAFNAGIPIAHLEAGLRTGNIQSPFPEEANRKIITQIATLNLAPTPAAAANLTREGVDKASIVVSGNTVIDALLAVRRKNNPITDKILRERVAQAERTVLITTHRRENIKAMKRIGEAIRTLSTNYPDVLFVLPAHLNPRVRGSLLPVITGIPNVLIKDALPYGDFTALLAKANLVLTDSGGVQEEAPSLGKPVLVMRENTERPEAVKAGTVRIVGTNPGAIVEETSKLLDNVQEYAQMANAVNPYGDGKAAERVCAAMAEVLGVGKRIDDFDPNRLSEGPSVEF